MSEPVRGANPRPACSDDGPAPEMSIIFMLQRERKFEPMLHAGMYCSGKKSKQFSELDHGRDRRCKSRETVLYKWQPALSRSGTDG